MAKSKQSEEILNLGKTLVEKFSDHGRTDLTTSWMAHYLAERIKEAEREDSPTKRKKLQDECSEIIKDLWAKRSNYPGAIRPLAGLGEAVAVLKSLVDHKRGSLQWEQFIDYENGSGWGMFLRKVRESMDNMLQIALCVAGTEDVLKNEKKWLKHEGLLSESEASLIKHLDTLLNRRSYQPSVVFVIRDDQKKKTVPKPKVPVSRLIQAFEKLESLLADQQEYLDKLKKEKLKPVPVRKKK